MLNSNHIFERTEEKYIVDDKTRDALMKILKDKFHPDAYGESTILSLYFDTENFILIRNSLEKPAYREKLRLRCYGIPHATSKVFIELKKKYNGIVYKRRVDLTYDSAKEYLLHNVKPPTNTQILNEIDYVRTFYAGLSPAALVCYDRTAFFANDDPALRITFDKRPRVRFENPLPENGDAGKLLLTDGYNIVEIKCSHSIPLYLAHALDALQIYPCSFSKYGTAYTNLSDFKGA